MMLRSWGGLQAPVTRLVRPNFSSDIARCLRQVTSPARPLVVGNLRSYGDEVLNPDGHYLQTTHCDRWLALDADAGTVDVETGVHLDTLQRRLAPLGLMLPVTPGTALATVGGAIANDVHGKNQASAGTFGCHVESFELARTDGALLHCSRDSNAELFAATLGGMGLTGAITRTRLRLRRTASHLLRVESKRFANLDEFFELDARLRGQGEYNVAWIDCLARGSALGRGVYSTAAHLDAPASTPPRTERRKAIPFTPPVSPIRHWTLAAFNQLYWRLHAVGVREVDYRQWLYPLDSILHWNRLYGPRGFRQFQCVVPPHTARAAIAAMLAVTSQLGEGSFLAVLKNFGARPSPGLMSFPMEGTTLALDFAERGPRTLRLLDELHALALDAGGRLYAAKDSCGPALSLQRGYPNLQRFRASIDPGLTSSLARRLGIS